MDTEPPDGSSTSANRRRLLAALGTLGITAFAGCGGGGDDTATPTGTAEGTTAGPTASGSDTDTPTETNTPTPTETNTPTPTETNTPTPGGCNIPDPPDPLVSFDDVRDGAVVVSPTSETMTGSFTNPYIDATLESGSVELDVPEGDWTIEPASGTTFDVLETQESREITWNVSVPAVREAFDVTVLVRYSCGEETYEVEVTQPVRIGPETAPPPFVEFDIADDVPGRSVVRQSAHFTPLQLISGGNAQMVYFTREAEGFQAAVFDWEGQYDDGEWHHCVASYDAAAGLRGFIDGELVVEQSEPAGELEPAELPFALAASTSNPIQELYEGALDEVTIYETALSGDQAGALAEGDGVAEDSLVSRWSFEEVVYDRVEDQVGDNTMFLANGPETVSGASGQAVQFDGEESYAGTPSSESLDLTEQKSVSFFFNTTLSV